MNDILVADIGNSAVKVGRFRGEQLVSVGRAEVRDGACDLDGLFDPWSADGPAGAAAFVSVVPGLTADVRHHLAARSDTAPVMVGAASRLPFRLAYDTPATLGSDRLAAAAGAMAWADRARPGARGILAVDAGTAVNIEVVVHTDDGPAYTGGVIAPGPELLRRAMRTGTAQLPDVPLTWPGQVVGSSTRSAIQSGLLPGLMHAVDGLLRDIELEVGFPCVVVATGGWGEDLAERLPRVDHVDPNLVLRGIREIAALNPAA